MPQITKKDNQYIVIAQADHGAPGEHTAPGQPSAPGEHTGGETHAGQGAAHEPVNPLKEYPALYFTFMGLLALGIVLLFSVITTRNLSTRTPSKPQLLVEQCVASIRFFCRNTIGPGGEQFAPFVGTVFAFVLVSNLFGILPMVVNRGHEGYFSLTPAPTANLSMTFALGLTVFLFSQYIGIKRNGFAAHFGHMAGPIPALAPLIFPIELIGTLVRPISLAMRLFGNIFGEETVIAVLLTLSVTALPVFVPIPFQAPMLAFGVFGSIVQAGVFTILTCAYIALAIGDHGDHEHGHHHGHDEAQAGGHAAAVAH
ncbi:MAG: F0F1 ATP synthase subunit A [Capsulimonadales bacterium]|nr:F0F1 ATP synthase subunit A [Capsulimonadales bacterium]